MLAACARFSNTKLLQLILHCVQVAKEKNGIISEYSKLEHITVGKTGYSFDVCHLSGVALEVDRCERSGIVSAKSEQMKKLLNFDGRAIPHVF